MTGKVFAFAQALTYPACKQGLNINGFQEKPFIDALLMHCHELVS